MNAAIDCSLFERELAGWGLRGVLCALPSAFWAVMVGFQQPGEIAAMIAGTAAWIIAFAWFSSWLQMHATPGRQGFAQSLKMAAWIKGATVPVAATGLALEWSRQLSAWTAWTAFIGLPDMIGGIGSLWAVATLAGVREPEAVGRLDSFGWTLTTTLLQGALISGLLVMLALALFGIQQVWPKMKQFLPARIPG